MQQVGPWRRWPGWGPEPDPAFELGLIQGGLNGCQPVLPRGRGATRVFGNGLTSKAENGFC